MSSATTSTKPNVFMVGAAKCGTTSLYRHLSRHPDVFFPSIRKELGFFVPDLDTGIRTLDEYLALFDVPSARDSKARVDLSTAYLFSRETAGRIRASIGSDVRIVVFIRNPADMAFSLWKQMVRYGYETLSFEEALAAEESRRSDPGFREACSGWHGNYYYYYRGRYHEQIARYVEAFGRERVGVFVFERFFAPGWPEWQALLEFIGVRPGFAPGGRRVHNPGGVARSPALRAYLQKPTPLKSLVGRMLPGNLRMRVKLGLDELNTRPYDATPEDQEAMRMLEERYADEVEKIEALLGEDLRDVWRPRK